MGPLCITRGTTKAFQNVTTEFNTCQNFGPETEAGLRRRRTEADGVIGAAAPSVVGALSRHLQVQIEWVARRLSNVTIQMLLYLYVNLRLLNKLTSEFSDFFTDAMRDSNSHEFREIVNFITCMPTKELEESLDEIDETLTQKESSVTTAFLWPNVSSQNWGGATKLSKIDNSVLVIHSTPASPQY